MSKFGFAAFASAAVVLLGVTISAQDRQDPLRPGEDAVPARPGDGPGQAEGEEEGFYRASEILGSTVRGEGGEELGQIQDLLIDRESQRISHFILGEDGAAQPARTERTRREPAREVDAQASVRVVPWNVAQPRFTPQERIVTVPLARQRFQQAPTFTWQQIQGPRAGWYGEVNRFYGVQGRGGRVEVERDGDVEIEGNRPGRPDRVRIDND